MEKTTRDNQCSGRQALLVRQCKVVDQSLNVIDTKSLPAHLKKRLALIHGLSFCILFCFLAGYPVLVILQPSSALKAENASEQVLDEKKNMRKGI